MKEKQIRIDGGVEPVGEFETEKRRGESSGVVFFIRKSVYDPIHGLMNCLRSELPMTEKIKGLFEVRSFAHLFLMKRPEFRIIMKKQKIRAGGKRVKELILNGYGKGPGKVWNWHHKKPIRECHAEGGESWAQVNNARNIAPKLLVKNTPALDREEAKLKQQGELAL